MRRIVLSYSNPAKAKKYRSALASCVPGGATLVDADSNSVDAADAGELLATADGLLLTLSNSLSHDMWYRVVSPRMSAARRVMVSKILLLVVAFGAAWVAARKPADILFMVSAAEIVAGGGKSPR